MPQAVQFIEGGTYAKRDRVLDLLGFADYAEYLQSPLWRKIRREFLYVHRLCRCCGSRAKQIHHRSYSEAVLKGENHAELVAICRKCHEKIEFRRGKKCSLQEANGRLDKLMGDGQAKRRPIVIQHSHANEGRRPIEPQVHSARCRVCDLNKPLKQLRLGICKACHKLAKRTKNKPMNRLPGRVRKLLRKIEGAVATCIRCNVTYPREQFKNGLCVRCQMPTTPSPATGRPLAGLASRQASLCIKCDCLRVTLPADGICKTCKRRLAEKSGNTATIGKRSASTRPRNDD